MVFNQIESVTNLLEKYYKKNDKKKEQKNFEKSLIVLYKLSEGSHSVSLYKLEKNIDLDRLEILDATKKAERKELIKDCTTNMGSSKVDKEWILTNEGILYIEGLLDKINPS